jgi:hypothetical protein
MSARRLPILAVLLLGLVSLVAFGSDERRLADSSFAALAPPGMPYAPPSDNITTSWFCPGVPASDRRGGDVIVTNPGDVPLRGRLTIFSTSGAPVIQPLQVAVRDDAVFKLEDLARGDYLSAMVEIENGRSLVEQRVRHPNGDALQPCSNAPSSTWYLADGVTENSGYDLIITNPFPDYTNVTVTVVTASGLRTPSALQNQTVAGRSVLKLDLEQFGLRDETTAAISVSATPHRIIVGRAQNYRGGQGRGGYSMTLAAPSLDDSWVFPDGEKGEGIQESLTISNPTDTATTVTVQIYTEKAPGPAFLSSQDYDVPDNGVVKVDIDALDGLPDGRHSIVVKSSPQPVVVEQAITRGVGVAASTAVSLGARVSSTRWWIPTPLDAVSQNSLVVTNQTAVDGTVSVLALGPGGLLPVVGLQDLPLTAAVDFVGGTLVIDLNSEDLLGKPLVVQSSVEVAVGRRPFRGGDLKGRTAVLAVPESGS